MLIIPTHDVHACQPHWQYLSKILLATPLMQQLQIHFGLQVKWFVSLLNRHASILAYAGGCPNDTTFRLLYDAYAYRWTGSGFVNAGMAQADVIIAVRWATASCYEMAASSNIIVVPAHRQSAALHASLQHP